MTHSKRILSPSGEILLSARKVALRLSCAPDYVGKLCREGKLRGTRVGNAWFVEEESIREFEITRELAKAQRSEELSRLRREENSAFQKASNPPTHQDISAKNYFSGFKPFSTAALLSIGGLMLLVSTVFAGVHSPSAFSQGNTQLAAAIAHIQSPFFGAQSITLTLPSAGANNLFQNFFGTLAALFKRDVVPPTVVGATQQEPVQTKPVQVPPVASSTRSVQTTNVVNNYNTYVTNPVTLRTTGFTASPSIPPEAFVMILSEFHRSVFDEIRRVVSGSLDRRGSSGGGSGGGSGSVTSVDASGGATGLTFSGGPITSSGTFTLGGVLDVISGGTGTSTAPTYGKLLIGNAAGGYDLVATSSLGIAAGGNPSWGNIIGTLSNQTDLQSALDSKLSLSAWFATTTDALDEGTSNLYFTNARV
ncbi:helix-turn-helix domain-containing protein, partial [Acetobacteraceae bacterium]|nr:helix-turn-helix domain-containing protein [Candidatus Parcubacteria bacterium]